MRTIRSIFMIGLVVFYGYRYRYRILNLLLGNQFLRRFFVTSFMNIPGVRTRISNTIFSNQ